MTAAELGLDLSRYKLGWSDEVDYVYKPKRGLNEEIIKEISWMKGEPQWMRDFRLKSYRHFQKRPMPTPKKKISIAVPVISQGMAIGGRSAACSTDLPGKSKR